MSKSAKNGTTYTLTLKVEALRRYAGGESKGRLLKRYGIGSLSTLSRWFKDPRVLRAAGLGRAESANIGVPYMGPYDELEVLPHHDGVELDVDLGDAAPPPRLPAKRGPGRPSKLEDPETVKKLRHGLRLLLPPKFLANYVGVSLKTLSNWEADAETGRDTPGARLGEIIKEARAEGVIRAHEAILSGDPGAKGSQFLLSRVYRDSYAERVEQSLTGSNPLADLSDEELDELERDA